MDRDPLNQLKEHVDSRFDRLEVKIDNHLERLTVAETSLEWLKGHVKLTTAIGVAVAGTVLGWWFTKVSGGL